MNGTDLSIRRRRLGYTQEDFIREIGVKSRQTIINWERSSDPLPRLVELALLALEKLPDSRRIEGKRATARERRAFERKTAVSASDTSAE